jgi:hypothetical protein
MSTPYTPDLVAENAELRAQLAEAEKTLAVVGAGACPDLAGRQQAEEAMAKRRERLNLSLPGLGFQIQDIASCLAH